MGSLTMSMQYVGLITIAENQERLTAEVEGRVIDEARPILGSRMTEFFRSEHFKKLVLQVVLEGLFPERE